MSDVISKEILLANLEDMPDQIRVADLLEDIRLLAKIERGIRDIDEGKFIPHEEVKNIVNRWFA